MQSPCWKFPCGPIPDNQEVRDPYLLCPKEAAPFRCPCATGHRQRSRWFSLRVETESVALGWTTRRMNKEACLGLRLREEMASLV